MSETKWRSLASIMLLATILSACGGGGGGSGAPISGVTPTPSPSPTPSPAPSYAVAFNPAIDQRLLWYTVESYDKYTRTGAPGTGVHSDMTFELRGEAVDSLNYRAADQSITILNAGRYGGVTEFAGSEIINRQDTYLSYVRSQSRLSVAALISEPGPFFGTGADGFRYLVVGGLSRLSGAFGFNEEYTRFNFVAGTRTLTTDIPASGSMRYEAFAKLRNVAPTESGSFSLSGRDSAFRFEFEANTFSGSFVLTDANSPGVSITLTVAGQINRETGEVRGTLASPEGYAGNFIGRLFGPAARELGLVFILGRGPERGTGTIVAKR